MAQRNWIIIASVPFTVQKNQWRTEDDEIEMSFRQKWNIARVIKKFNNGVRQVIKQFNDLGVSIIF